MSSTGEGPSVQWTRRDVVLMINYFGMHPCLWNIKHPDYYSRIKKIRLLKNLSEELKRSTGHAFSVIQLKSKFKNLRTAFGRELKKVKAKKIAGIEDYASQWHHFDKLRFLQGTTTTTPHDHGESSSNPQEYNIYNQMEFKFEDVQQYEELLVGDEGCSAENLTDHAVDEQPVVATCNIPQNQTRTGRRLENQDLMSEDVPVHNESSDATIISLNKELADFWQSIESKLRKLSSLKRLVVESQISNLVYTALIEEATHANKARISDKSCTESRHEKFHCVDSSKNALNLSTTPSTEVHCTPKDSIKSDHQTWHTTGGHPFTDSPQKHAIPLNDLPQKRTYRKEATTISQTSLYSNASAKEDLQHQFESEIMIEAPETEYYTSDADDGSNSILPEVSEPRQIVAYIPAEQQQLQLRTIQQHNNNNNNAQHESNHSVESEQLETPHTAETEDTLFGKYVALRMGRLNRTQKYRFRRTVEDLLFEMDNENCVE